MRLAYDEIENEYKRKLDKLFGVENCLIEVNPGGVLIPRKYQELGERILNMEVRHDDVWVVSYPRTGSTWAQEMVWCIVNNLDYDGAKLMSHFRNPLLELTALLGNDTREWKNALGNSVELVENMPSPRCIKTHLPWCLLPKKLSIVQPKIIYVTRNPKDVSVSYYHYSKLMHEFQGTYEDFCELFIQEKTPIGSYWKHVRDFWLRRDDDNILFLKFEDMKKNNKQIIEKTAKFLGKMYTDDEINKLMEHLSFTNMRENPAINLEPLLEKMYEPGTLDLSENSKFIRKGQIGEWKNYMSNEMSEQIDRKNAEYLSDIGLTFD